MPGNICSLIYKNNIEQNLEKIRKPTDPRVYKSFNFAENFDSNVQYKRNLK